MMAPRARLCGRAIAPLLAALALFSVLATGCGKKGPPRLPDVEAPVAVNDLQAGVEGDDVVLRWTVPDEEGLDPAGYHVFRSAESVAEAPCEGCPVLFRRVAEILLERASSDGRALIYREPLEPGTRYQFKVAPYDAAGLTGPDSNIVRLVTE